MCPSTVHSPKLPLKTWHVEMPLGTNSSLQLTRLFARHIFCGCVLRRAAALYVSSVSVAMGTQIPVALSSLLIHYSSMALLMALHQRNLHYGIGLYN